MQMDLQTLSFPNRPGFLTRQGLRSDQCFGYLMTHISFVILFHIKLVELM